jgi:peptide/nickel transport system permease protein
VTQRYEADETRSAPVAFFVHGYQYRLLGLIPTDIHLFGLAADKADGLRIQLLGTDQLGRDRFSRLLYATRFSLLVSPIGTILASLLGVLIGTVSGYSNRMLDSIVMGVTDAVIALPALVIILAARVAFPLELPASTAAFLLIGIFTLTGWAEMARLARGLVRSTKEMEFVAAAKATGVRPARILFRHILPNISRPLITQATVLLPAFLLAEAALSFLGVGLQEPEPSLGNMLTAAEDMAQLNAHPFLVLSPALVIFLFVLGVRLVSSGLKKKTPRSPL